MCTQIEVNSQCVRSTGRRLQKALHFLRAATAGNIACHMMFAC